MYFYTTEFPDFLAHLGNILPNQLINEAKFML